MNCELLKRIHAINLSEPYFWRLHLSKQDFDELAAYVPNHTDDALAVMAYIAEWYKREYRGENTDRESMAFDPDSAVLEKIWQKSGINIDRYVYRTDSGAHLWRYSLYVLGGLPIHHELARSGSASDNFLKRLCRIYHGDYEMQNAECKMHNGQPDGNFEFCIENFEFSNRAIAFRQSIINHDSLYHYLKEILNSDYTDKDPNVNALIEAIRRANDEELRIKFRLEWLIANNSDAKGFRRRLTVLLRPEEVGEGLNQYIRHDRLRVWGLTNPNNCKYLYFSLRFLNGKKVVQDATIENRIITCANQGEYGFVTMGVEKSITTKYVPVERFDKVEIVMFPDAGAPITVQTESIEQYMQVYRVAENSDEWSSRKMPQCATSVFFSDPWKSEAEPDRLAKIIGADGNLSKDVWSWCYIHSDITIIDGDNHRHTFYNHQGFDYVTTKLYTDTIRYIEGGNVRLVEGDEEEGDIDTLLPLIFGKDDVIVRHFATKTDEAPIDKVAQQIEYKQPNGRYAEWTDDDRPIYGRVELRIIEKGIDFHLSTLYLPGVEAERPIIRELDSHIIRYRNLHNEVVDLKDDIVIDYTPLAETTKITYHLNDEQKIDIDIYRPINITEVSLDGKVYTYADDKLVIPYVLKQRIDVRVFSADGYQRYDCRTLPSIWQRINDGTSNMNLAEWGLNNVYDATWLDARAPKTLCFTIGSGNFECQEGVAADAAPADAKFYYWDMYTDHEPIKVHYGYAGMAPKDSIVFQSMADPGKDLYCIKARERKHDAFKRRDISELRCYEIAASHRIYFFAFDSLRSMVSHNRTKERLVKPLLEKRGGMLTPQDVLDLARFADEFSINIEELLSMQNA